MSHDPTGDVHADPFEEALGCALVPLSAEGERRRLSIGQTLRGRVASRRRVRRLVRAAAVLVAAAGLSLSALRRMEDAPGQPPSTRPERPPSPSMPGSPWPPTTVVAVVHNDPAVIGRCEIDDEALIRMLDQIGRPAGLLRFGERVILTHDVVDPVPVAPIAPG